MSNYDVWRFLHILGVVLLIGNVTVSSVWKVFADRTRDPGLIAFAQRLVTYTDWSLTLSGVILIVAGGYGMVHAAGMAVSQGAWLVWGQVLFVISGAIWLIVLVPAQIEQARLARSFNVTRVIPPRYWVLSRRWLIWGIAATVPLVAAMWLMVGKPT